jgi:hypothetical protein
MGLGFSPKTASEERLSLVKAPVLVVMGTKDPDWPTEMPEQVTPAILDFLARVRTPA